MSEQELEQEKISHEEKMKEEKQEGKVEDEEETEQPEGFNYEEWKGTETMQSLCISCGGTGTTRFMFHKIPYFREIILASFICPECGERNNEVTFGGQIQLFGCRYTLLVTSSNDTNRQIIKSDSASVIIPEIQFEIPALTQKGEISTIEGILKTAAKNLSFSQPVRRIETPEIAKKIDDIIDKLEAYAEGETLPYSIVIDDPAGNSFIENPFAPKHDPHLSVQHYTRTKEQDAELGIETEKGIYKKEETIDDKIVEYISKGEKEFGGFLRAETDSTTTVNIETPATAEEADEMPHSKAVTLPAACPNCHHLGESHTAITHIPHFKEVIIMSFTCAICGFRTNDVKGGGSIPTYGTEVKLTVASEADMKRDVLKSDTTMVIVPELDLELQGGTLGGMFTTVEGLLQKILKNLDENSPIVYGDSKVLQHSNDASVANSRKVFEQFLAELSDIAFGRKFPFTLILRDPLGNSFISAPLGTFLPPESDKNLELTDYERSHEENEDLGLNDLNTRDYETGVDDENATQGPVLPDRLTENYHKVVDHPTFFAKGTDINDTTDGGAYINDQKHSEDNHTEDTVSGCANFASEDYYQPPPGWKFEKNLNELPDHSHSKQNHHQLTSDPPSHGHRIGRDLGDDSDLDYIPREEFGGARPGYVFRLGSKGIGYYEDRYSHKQ